MFVTVGASPRRDLIDEITASLGLPVEALEVGVLDGLDAAAVRSYAVRPGEQSIVSRLGDGAEVVLGKPRIAARMAEIVAGLPTNAFDLVAILSTGLFRDFESSSPTVNTQRAVECAIISLAAHGDAVGLIQPLRRQVDEIDIPALAQYEVRASHAHGADPASLDRAQGELRDCDILVLNSVSFTEMDRQVVAAASGKPVVLARRIVAGAIRLLLDRPQPISLPGIAPELGEKLNRLTPRERQVLSLAAEGLSNKAVARQLSISPKTVEIHRSNVMRKMDVGSSGALIRLVAAGGYF